MAPSRLAAEGGVSSGAFTLLEGRMLVRRGRASCVPVMVDVFASQAAPWELAPRSHMQAGALRRAAQQGQLSHTQLCLLFPGVTCGEGRTLQRHHVGRLCAREGGQGQRGQVGKVPHGAGALRIEHLPSGDHQGLGGFVFTLGLRRCCAFYKEKVCSSPASSQSVGTVFPTASARFVVPASQFGNSLRISNFFTITVFIMTVCDL